MDDIEKEVTSIISRITGLPESRLTPDTDLRTDFNVDSLQGLRIVAALEKRFEIVVTDDDLDMYSNVRTIVETVNRYHRAPAAAPAPSHEPA